MSSSTMLYESFNARNMTPEQVASTFVRNEAFDLLWRNQSSILLGPRGSGKTTMLKMLTAPALHTWTDGYAEKIKREVTFSSIYIPTDIHWHRQLIYSMDSQVANPNAAKIVSQVAVTTNVFLAAIQTMKDRISYESRISSKAVEEKLCRQIMKSFLLDDCMPRLTELQTALRDRINKLRIYVNKMYDIKEISNYPDYFYLDFSAALSNPCNMFVDLYKSKKRRWALCFDELELAPVWLQDRLFSELRSTDEIFLYKLCTSPVPKHVGFSAASPKNDFSTIRLWPYGTHEVHEFSKRLLDSYLSRKLNRSVDGTIFFGDEDSREDYNHGGKSLKMFQEVATQDESFRKVLLSHGIDPKNPYTDDISLRDQVLRKARPIVEHRQAFRKQSKGGVSAVRSRKVSTLYHGINAICSIGEGNPRWLIGIVDDMLLQCEKQSNGS